MSPSRFPYLNNTIFDTHFVARDRMGRMLAFLARIDTDHLSSNQKPRGIGHLEAHAIYDARVLRARAGRGHRLGVDVETGEARGQSE